MQAWRVGLPARPVATSARHTEEGAEQSRQAAAESRCGLFAVETRASRMPGLLECAGNEVKPSGRNWESRESECAMREPGHARQTARAKGREVSTQQWAISV